jgi:hypothetical protein
MPLAMNIRSTALASYAVLFGPSPLQANTETTS